MQIWSECSCCTEAAAAFSPSHPQAHIMIRTCMLFNQSVSDLEYSQFLPFSVSLYAHNLNTWNLNCSARPVRRNTCCSLQKRPCICIMTGRSDLVPGARPAYAIVWICKSKCAQSTFQSEADAQIFIAAVSACPAALWWMQIIIGMLKLIFRSTIQRET